MEPYLELDYNVEGNLFLSYAYLVHRSLDTKYLNRYNLCMHCIQQTQKFSHWLTKLKDMRARIAITRRIERAQNGNLGDVQSVGKVCMRCALI